MDDGSNDGTDDSLEGPDDDRDAVNPFAGMPCSAIFPGHCPAKVR